MSTPSLRQPASPGGSTCPHFGTSGADSTPGPYVDYPSFENRCWAGERPVPLLLTDQATLCLCSAYRQCPRFVAARAVRRSSPVPTDVPMHESAPAAPPADDPISQSLHELQTEMRESAVNRVRSRQRWGWIGAGLIFMSSILCGGIFAGYVGWQLVSTDLLATSPGTVDTLAQTQPPPQPQIYLIVTATTEPASPGPLQEPRLEPEALASVAAFPPAVTPTPVAVNPGQPEQVTSAQLEPLPQAVQDNGEPDLLDNGPASSSAPSPAINVQLEIPTRRPTPVLDIPTSTPAALQAEPTPLPTPTPQLGTPVVLFAARDTDLESGDCTLVTWHVENVRAVFYENLGVDGRGEREECMDDDPEDYNLTVIMPNGGTQIYTVTVGLIKPTDTPRPTPTYTEVAEPTPTWTPSIPTNTPTPEAVRGVRLEVDGGTVLACSPGTTCETELFVSNTGNAIDNLAITFTEAGVWPRQVCRLDGVCSDDRMTLVAMGPSSTGVVRLRITVPADAEPGTVVYELRADSEASGGAVVSNTVRVEVQVE